MFAEVNSELEISNLKFIWNCWYMYLRVPENLLWDVSSLSGYEVNTVIEFKF